MYTMQQMRVCVHSIARMQLHRAAVTAQWSQARRGDVVDRSNSQADARLGRIYVVVV